MTDMILAVRITADGAQLVGQLNAAEAKALSLKGAMGSAAQGTDQLSRAADGAVRSQRAAAGASDGLARAQRDQAAAARAAAREQQVAEQAVTKSLSRQRQGYQQVGFQIQDFFTQVGAGASPMTAFVQQSGQMAGALQIIGGEADGSKGKMAAFGAFLGGPFGIALGVALPLIGILATALFSSGDAADKAKVSNYDFTDALFGRMGVITDYTAAIQQLDGATRGLINTQSLMIEGTKAFAAEAVSRLDGQLADLDKRRAEIASERSSWFNLPGILSGSQENLRNVRLQQIDRERRARQQDRDSAAGSLARANVALTSREIAEAADPDAGRRARNARRRADLQRRRELSIRSQGSVPLDGEDANFISDADFRKQLSVIEADDQRKPDRSGRKKNARSSAAEARRQSAELERVRNSGLQAADAIARINDQWAGQPTLIQKANEANRDLNKIIRETEERIAKGGLGKAQLDQLNDVLAKARAAQGTVQAGQNKPYQDMVESFARAREQQLLILQGREREAEVLALIQQQEERGVVMTAEKRAEIERILAKEEQINDLLAKRETIIGIYQQSIGDLRSSLEGLFSGGTVKDFLKDMRRSARQLQGKLMVERLFGDGLRQIEKQIRQETGFEGAVNALDEQTRVAADAMGLVGDAAQSLAGRLSGASTFAGTVGAQGGSMETAMLAAARAVMASPGFGTEGFGQPDILVEGRRGRNAGPTVAGINLGDIFDRIARVTLKPITDLAAVLDKRLGTQFFGKLGGALEGAYSGFMQGGPVMGALKAVGSLADPNSPFGKGIGKAIKGAETGQQVAQIGKSLGIKTSTTGGQIGAMIGSALPIPGGEVIGAIWGSIVGGMIKSTKRGSASITNTTGDAALSGNSTKFKAQSNSLATGLQDTLASIAEQLGGSVGTFAVSIGVRDGKLRVDPTGRGNTKTKKGAIDFGEDQDAAVRAAVIDAISDGGIAGLSAAVQRALQSSSNLERGLKEAFKVREVEDIIGGLGSVIERQFRMFEGQAKDRVRIASQYGFDVVKIEARNAEDRKKLVDQILGERVGSLQQLLKDFQFGNLFEGSAAERRTALLGEVGKARTDAEAGVDGAAQRLADLTRQLVETSRDAYGTAGSEFASDRTNAISAAERVIAIENERIKAAQDAAVGTRDAVVENNRLTNETNDLLAEIAAGLRRGGDPIYTPGGGGGGSIDVSIMRSVSLL